MHDLLERATPEEYQAATFIMEAAAHAWTVHVAAEMREAGDSTIWRYLESRNVYRVAAEAYAEALSCGRTVAEACTWAFDEVLGEDKFCDMYYRVAREDVPARDVPVEADALDRMIAIIAANSPAGQPYDREILDGAIHHVRNGFSHVRIERKPLPSVAP